MLNINIKKTNTSAKIPTRASPTDAGADLYSVEDCSIFPMQRKMVATGVQLEIPEGYYGRIAPRSGLALKQGIDVLAGVIDSSYRGEIKVIIFNTDNQKVFKVNVGDRIAQLIIEKHYNFDFVEVEDLETTDRGEGGFGSSGS